MNSSNLQKGTLRDYQVDKEIYNITYNQLNA